MTSMARKRLKATNGPIVERAVRDHPRADEQHGRLREQRQEREERHVGRALPVRADRLREERLVAAANFASSAGSCANALTTWTPTMFSSETVATSASFCWTSRSVGCATWL